MDASTVHQSTFTLKYNSGYPVSGTVESTSQTAIFHPFGGLAYSTTYIATITTGVRDVAGNALSSELTWTFTTETWPTPAPPTGLTAVPGDGKVTLSWNLASDTTISYNLYWGTSPGVTKNNGNQDRSRPISVRTISTKTLLEEQHTITLSPRPWNRLRRH